MARINPVPPLDVAIGHRLREFRLARGLSLVEFGKRLDTGPGSVAAYESGRIPLPWRVAQALERRFFISFRWLVEGDGPRVWPLMAGPKMQANILPRALLSDVYFCHLKPFFDVKILKRLKGFDWDDAAGFDPEQRLAVGALIPEDVAWLAFWAVAKRLKDASPDEVRQCLETILSALGEKTWEGLTVGSNMTTVFPVTPTLTDLLEQVRAATKGWGDKAALAEFLGVPRSLLSKWLSGVVEPSGAVTLRLLAWVQAGGARKTSGGRGALTPKPPKTRPGTSYEKRNQSGPREP